MVKEFPITVVGTSMNPTYGEGEKLICHREQGYIPNIGDIVVCKNKIFIYAHRVVECDFPYIVTKGDNNFLSDYPIHIDNVIGWIEKAQNVYGLKISDWKQEYLAESNLFTKKGVKYIREPKEIDDKEYNILLTNMILDDYTVKSGLDKSIKILTFHIGNDLLIESENSINSVNSYDIIVSLFSHHGIRNFDKNIKSAIIYEKIRKFSNQFQLKDAIIHSLKD